MLAPCRIPTAHPRSRGEHRHLHGSFLLALGSPPLARGTQHVRLRVGGDARLTPARAGNTRAGVLSLTPTAAHPRSRGEHQVAHGGPPLHFGSPPLARGTRTLRLRFIPLPRLTPARAGNTLLFWGFPLADTAHPRSRGEHPCNIWSRARAGGSPPLARGTHQQNLRHHHPHRLTPARAGNTG